MGERLPRVWCPVCHRQVTARQDGVGKGRVNRHTRFRDERTQCAGVGQLVALPTAAMARRMAEWSRMSEAAWQRLVFGQLAPRCGWRIWHDNDSRRNTEGLPDGLLWRPSTREWMGVELKTEDGAMTTSQWALMLEWRDCGLEVHVWRPRDQDDVVARLRP